MPQFKLIINILLLTVICSFNANSQKFWLTTYEFPYGPKTSITGISDTLLYVSSTNAVLRSSNEGDHWEKVLNAENVYTVLARENGTILAGGTGKIYLSDDYGNTWDSVSLGHNYAVTRFVLNSDGELFAITGHLWAENGFAGAGVFYTNSDGQQWQQINNGLGSLLGCEQIAIDRNNRIYVTVADENISGDGGLYISDNNGMLWEHIPITIDGRGVILNEIKVGNNWGLNITPDDSVYLTVSGVSGSAAVQLNLSKSINDVTNSNHWNCRNVNKSSFWWLDRLLNGIHFAKNGDWYSSIMQSATFGGTYFSKDKGQTWNHHTEGLGLDENGLRSKQFFYEKPNGKIFMVQYLDERVYWADTSVVTSIKQPVLRLDNIHVYPNPVLRNGHINLSLGNTCTGKTITLINTNGSVLSKLYTTESHVTQNVPELPGIYFLKIEEVRKSQLLKLLVL